MAEVANAYVSLLPSARGFGRKLDSDIGPQLDKSGKAGSKRFGGALSSGLKSALAPGLAILGTAGVGAFLKGAVDEAREAQKVGALTNNVIKQTGGIANVTAKQVGKLATAISNKSGIDDEAIQSGANLLLTFKNVRNEAGKGADIFDRATQAAVDLSASGFGDLAGTSKQLGKALNDPIKGISALGRAGVTFTAGQKKQIAGFVKANDLLSAQKIILKEVESQVGGSAAASATAGEKMSVAFGNLQETVGTALLPVIDKFEKKLTSDIIPAISTFVTGMQDGTGAGGSFASTIGDIYSAAKPIGTVIASIVKGFAGLPGSSQKVLLLAGALAVLSSKTQGLRQSASDAVLNIRTMPDEMRKSAVAAAAMKGGLVAASVGLAAVAASSSDAKVKLGAATASAAAMGYVFAGPAGAAIGAGGVLLSALASRGDKAAAAEARLNSSLGAVTATLNQQTGAMTKLTTSTVAKTLADNGSFDAARRVGASYRDVLAAALGSEAATKRVTAATNAWVKKQGDDIGSKAKVIDTTNKLAGVINKTTGAIDGQRKKITQVNEAMGKGKDKTVKYTVQTPGLGGAIGGLAALGRSIDTAIAKSAKLSRTRIGKNAKGTDNWRGGLTWVGEEGPELINLAKGAQVIPNHKIGDVSPRSALSGGMGGMPDMPIVDGSQIIGYLRDVATVQARIEVTASSSRVSQDLRFA